MPEQESPPVAYLVTLHGQVQGIGLRKRIQHLAREHGVTGWVRNRKAGHVEAHLEGAAVAVGKLLAVLQPGLLQARLDSVVTTMATASGHQDFVVITNQDMTAIQPSLLSALHLRVTLLDAETRDAELQLRDIMRHAAPEQGEMIAQIAREIPSRYLGEPLVQRQKRLPFRLRDVVCSFASENWAQKVVNQALGSAGLKSPEAILDDKWRGQEFARAIGLKTPKLYQRNIPLEDFMFRPRVVLKPTKAASSRGVYSIISDENIVSLETNNAFSSRADFLADARAVPGRIGRPDSWLVEELIPGVDAELPNDLKMLTFYGRVALVQEATRMPTRLCYYDRDGNKISTGRYEDRLFDGTGLLPEYITLAEEVSLKVPIPFMRLDFLKSAKGPVFGEFTPKPGNFQGFNTATDAWLGRCYAEARGRLMADLLKGKRFVEYDAFLESLNT